MQASMDDYGKVMVNSTAIIHPISYLLINSIGLHN
jgi:hypothetical protein